MDVCRRCVCVLRSSARLWRRGAPGPPGPPGLYCTTTAASGQRSACPGHQISQSRGGRWESCGVRFLSEQPANQSRAAEEDFRRLGSGGAVALPVDQTMMDLEAVSPPSPFEEVSEEDAVQILVPAALPPSTFTLRDYVDKSQTLKYLLQLGADLSKLEQRRNVGSMLVRLDFQTDVAPRLFFLKDLGVEDSQLGPLLTKNPFILTESLEDLQARVSYLRSRRFSSEAVAVLVTKAPYLLNFSVERLDNRLGFYQEQLGLTAQKTRDVVTRLPRLLCCSLEPVKENLKVCELEFGFRRTEIQQMVTRVPKVLTANKRKLTQVFDFVHNILGVPHSLIVKFPQVLNSSFLRIRERHLFLRYLERDHYDPAHPSYVSLERLVTLPDQVFCSEVALASLHDFERFQKTL